MLDAEAMAEIMEGVNYVQRAPKLMEILVAVSEVYGIGKMDLMSNRRSDKFVEARDCFYWLARHLTPRTYPEIGQFLADRDHSSVWAGVERASERFHKHKPKLVQVLRKLGRDPMSIEGK